MTNKVIGKIILVSVVFLLANTAFSSTSESTPRWAFIPKEAMAKAIASMSISSSNMSTTTSNSNAVDFFSTSEVKNE